MSKIFALLAFAYLARVLGPAHFGMLEFALAVMFFFTLLVDCGLSPFGAREVAKDEGAVTRLVAHIILLRALTVMAAFAVLLLGVAATDMPWAMKRLIVLYGLTLFTMPAMLPWVFQGRDLMRYVAVASIIRWFIFAAGVFLYVRGPGSLWIVPVVEGAALACVAVFYLGSFSRHFGSLRRRIDSSFAGSVFRQALPIGGSELVWALKMYSATVLLGMLVTGPEVGWFGAAHRIVISVHTFVWLYFFTLFPSVARSSRGSLEVLHRLTNTSLQVTAWSGVFLGVVGSIFAHPIITLVYGPEYGQSVAAFRVLIWVIPLALMSGHYRYALIAYGRQGMEFLTAACGAGLNVLVNLFLIPSYGLIGAAWALIVSEILIWTLAYYSVHCAITQIPFWPHVWRPLVGGVILMASLLLLPSVNMWMAAGWAVLVYGCVISVIQPKILIDARSIIGRNR